jgi:hypothetical protein
MTPQKYLVIQGSSLLFRKKFGPPKHRVGEHSKEYRRSFESTSDAQLRIWLPTHVCVRSTPKFRYHRVASKAKWSCKEFIVVLTGCVIFFNQETRSPTKLPFGWVEL